MNLKRLVAVLATMALITGAKADTYTIDPAHSTIGFKVVHMVISKVSGHFKAYTATLDLDASNQLTSATASVEAKSIDTGNDGRDKHLQSPDFFDAAKYPALTFKTTKVVQSGTTGTITGDLTIHGVTKEINVPFTLSGPIVDPYGKTRVGLEATTTIDRTEYGLTWNKALETGGMVVSKDVTIEISMEATKDVPDVKK